jgi:ABC-type Mn2+/Zn2+ transport system permease subunit
MLADRWGGRLAVGWVIAATASLVGLFASYQLDLPTGAAIVCACGLLLVFVSLVTGFRGRVA